MSALHSQSLWDSHHFPKGKLLNTKPVIMVITYIKEEMPAAKWLKVYFFFKANLWLRMCNQQFLLMNWQWTNDIWDVSITQSRIYNAKVISKCNCYLQKEYSFPSIVRTYRINCWFGNYDDWISWGWAEVVIFHMSLMISFFHFYLVKEELP